MNIIENNGSKKLIWWLMTTFCAVLLTGGGFFANAMYGKVDSIEKITSIRGERLSALEANYNTIQSRLTRIEDKLDKLLYK